MVKEWYVFDANRMYLVITNDIRNLINRKDMHLINTECALGRLVKRGEPVWDYCRGCKENDCMYNLGLEERVESEV